MNEREHAVLSLFYDEGNREVTPSLVAYRMRMSTDDATKLLDGMVKNGTLDLNIGTEGHIGYRLPPSERHRIEQHHRQQRPAASDHRPTGARSPSPDQRKRPSSGSRRQDGTDASVGNRTDDRWTAGQVQQSHTGPVGTDGSLESSASPVVDTASVRGVEPSTSQPDPDPYEDWYTSDPDTYHHDGSRSAGRPTATASAPSTPHPNAPPGTSRSLPGAPTHQPPARRDADVPADSGSRGRPRRHRIPVLAGALSLLVPGLGQFYNGELGKGVMVLFSYLFLWVFWLFWVVHIWSVIDAYMVAEQSNQRDLLEDHDNTNRPLLPDRHPRGPNPNSSAA